MEEISPKEWAISAIVILLTVAFGVFFNPFLTDRMFDEVRSMEQAYQIDGSPEQFQYLYKTAIGNVLAYGQMTTSTPVSAPELIGTFSVVERVSEHYTMHTRQVCTSSNGKTTCRTETYWTWDVRARDWAVPATMTFSGVEFKSEHLALDAWQRYDVTAAEVKPEYASKVKDGMIYYNAGTGLFGLWGWGDDRYIYYVTPLVFNATMYVKFDGNYTSPTEPNNKINVYFNQTRDVVIKDKRQDIVVFNIFYYAILAVLIVGIYYYWAYSYGDVE